MPAHRLVLGPAMDEPGSLAPGGDEAIRIHREDRVTGRALQDRGLAPARWGLGPIRPCRSSTRGAAKICDFGPQISVLTAQLFKLVEEAGLALGQHSSGRLIL